jgi:hypothetical protein
LFANLNISDKKKEPEPKPEPILEKDDAWALGKKLVNLNLKESMNLNKEQDNQALKTKTPY